MTCINIMNVKQRARFSLVLCVAVVFLVQSRAAGALPGQVEGQIIKLIVDGNRGTFDLPTHMDRLTAIDFPEAVDRVTGKIGPWIKTKFSGKRLFVKMKKPADHVLTMHVQANGLYVTFIVLPAAKPEEAYALAVVVPRTEDERRKQEVERATAAERARIQAKADQRIQETLRKQFPDVSHKISKHFAQGLVEQARAMQTRAERGEMQARGSAAPCKARVDVGSPEVEKGVTLIAFGVMNGCASAYSVGEVLVLDKYKSIDYGGTPIIWAPTRSGKPDVLAEIGPGEEAIGLVMVESAAVASGPLMLRVTGPRGLQPLVAATKQFGFVPIKPPFERTMSLHVQALAGGIWLANPQNDKDLDPTSVKGLGVRVGYHLAELLAVEVDVVGASSGESRFPDEQYNGQQGDLLRRAKLGRVSFGGALRLSSGRYVPVLRLGLGLQGASHNAEFEVGGVRMAGPDVDFELNPLWFFGAGMDARLGNYFTAGVALSVEQLVGSSSRSLEAGLHLGYSWKP